MSAKTIHGSCTIIHRAENKDINEIRAILKKAEKKNEKLYDQKINSYELIVCNSPEELNKKAKLKEHTPVATFQKGKIFILTPSKLPKGHALSFLLYHELNHLMYKHITGTIKPTWLSEGIAMLNQSHYKPQLGWKKYLASIPDKRKLLKGTHPTMPIQKRNEFYIASYFCVQYLEKMFGKKLITFLKKIPKPYTEKKFWHVFEKQFKLTRKQLVEKALA